MALLKNRQVVEDSFTQVDDAKSLPADGPVLVSLTVWQDHWDRLMRRKDAVGVFLASSEHPEVIADDLDQLAVVALEFPTFRDGRAYSYARLLRERYGFAGELRAIGDVLLEQLHYMERVGFDAFEVSDTNPEAAIKIASDDFSVWYQPSGDDRTPASFLRHKAGTG